MFRNAIPIAIPVVVLAFGSFGSALGDDMSEMAQWCTTEATSPSSIIICSDPELRRLAVIRNKIFADARGNLDPDDMQVLQDDQNRWIHEYTAACGASVNGPPISLPVPQEVIECYKQAGRERIAALAHSLREVIPNYQVPSVSGAIPAASAVSLINGTTTFKVVGIASYDWLNIRQQATTQSPIVGVIPPNGAGVVYAGDHTDDGSWFLVRYGDTTGWVASQYLAADTPAVAPQASTPSPTPPAAAEEERRRLQTEAQQEQLFNRLKGLGFQLLTPVDLDLDWKAFMTNNTRVAIRGTYIEANDVEELFTPDNKDQPRIRLYTDYASRPARKAMLECRNSKFAATFCEMVVAGTIESCVRNKGELNEKEIPCLKVQEAYLIP